MEAGSLLAYAAEIEDNEGSMSNNDKIGDDFENDSVDW